MATPLERYNALKTKVETLATNKAKAEGALAQQMTRLKEEFGVDTIAEAREHAAELNTEADEAAAAFEEALTAFEKEWGDVI